MRKILFTLAIILPLFSKDCYAYLDPGTGSYVLQILLASILGALFSIKVFWSKIRSFFSKLFSRGK